jgi:hypothetical protein
MTAPRILRRNIGDEGVLGTPNPVMLSTLPPANLQTQPRNEMARTAGLTAQVITMTWAANQRATMVALGRHNLTTAGTIRAELFSDVALTVGIGDSGTLAAFTTANLSRVDADDYLDDRFRGKKNWYYYFPLLTTIRGLRLTLTDAANPAGYMEAARLFVGEYFEFAYDLGFGSEGGGSMSLSKQGRSDGGDLWSDRGADYEVQRLDTDFMQDAEVPEFLAIASKLGTHTDFWLDMIPGDNSAKGIYRRGQRKFTSTGMLEPREYGVNRQSFEAQEP